MSENRYWLACFKIHRGLWGKKHCVCEIHFTGHYSMELLKFCNRIWNYNVNFIFGIVQEGDTHNDVPEIGRLKVALVLPLHNDVLKIIIWYILFLWFIYWSHVVFSGIIQSPGTMKKKKNKIFLDHIDHLEFSRLDLISTSLENCWISKKLLHQTVLVVYQIKLPYTENSSVAMAPMQKWAIKRFFIRKNS